MLLFGCVSAPTLETKLADYVGLSVAEVIQKLGEPNATSVDEKGRRILIFGKRSAFQYPDCIASFVLGENERVFSWNWSDRHCEAFAERLNQ